MEGLRSTGSTGDTSGHWEPVLVALGVLERLSSTGRQCWWHWEAVSEELRGTGETKGHRAAVAETETPRH